VPPSEAPAPDGPDARSLPEPVVEKRRRFRISLVWLVPLVALAIGASLLVRTLFLTGPTIEIEFASADGVEAGRTEVRFKEVPVGRVQSVRLSEDRRKVVVGVKLDRSAGTIAVADTIFWVVKPRIGAGGVTGLGTLLSGAYIGVDVGVSQEAKSRFVGLEAPPYVLRGEPGSIFVLRADELNSLDVGSPVYYRRTRVGRVVGYTLDAQKDDLTVRVFVEAPYQRLVTTKTHFWNASGIDVSLDANGLRVNTQTLASLLAGGLAFDEPAEGGAGTPAPAHSIFFLYADRQAALAPLDGTPIGVRMTFDGTVRGLAAGAPVDFLGVEVGKVRSFTLQYDAARRRYPVQVVADIYPMRFGAVRQALAPAGANEREAGTALLGKLVESGLKAQLRTGNLLTGQLYVALDFMPRSGAVRVGTVGDDLVLPTAPGTLAELQPQLADIVAKVSRIPFDEIGAKVNRIPFEEIGRDLRQTMRGAREAIDKLSPEAQKSLAEVTRTLGRAQASLDRLDRNLLDPSAPVQRQVEDTLGELQRAAESLRTLADYLQRHPESLLRGKPADPKVPTR
jgi:paraquat-inducible protein B